MNLNKIPILVIASTNIGKVNEFKSLLNNFPIEIIRPPNDLIVKETGRTFIENARIKATITAEITSNFCLADDSGLCIESLNGKPGIHSARYAKNDYERVQRVLKELSGNINRSAYFMSALCIASPKGKVLLQVQGRCDGVITFSPRGENGFGYDPIFEVTSIGKTFAEMEKEIKHKVGHRGKAFELLKHSLAKIINDL